jgi:NADPH:quinone reductase-like Zn-dependent oxidoreductase
VLASQSAIALENARLYAALSDQGIVSPTPEVRPTVAWPAAVPADVTAGQAPRVTPATPYRLSIAAAALGILENLELRPVERRTPGPGEVEIRVRAAALNFIDVLKAMGLYPGQDPDEPVLGLECSGEITAGGASVERLRVGDPVLAAAAGAFGSHVVTPAAFVARKPAFLAHEQAAGLPMAFMTAHYALHHLARVRRGERVLIHSAAGGTGLAAVQLALHAGAEVFATAGSPTKRAYLAERGVTHVMESRNLAFADAVLARTGGDGVDIVLNSLTGDAIARGLGVLGPYGRFVEIGKRDIYQGKTIPLAPFRKSLSYFAVDLAGMVRERPALYATLLAEVMELVEARAVAGLPATVFPMARVVDAFHAMAQAKHVGKIVVSA